MTTLIATSRNMLTALSAMLDKAATHEDAGQLMDARLADDMLPLTAQIRMVANFPRQAINAVSSAELPSNDEDPASLDEAKTRLAETLAMLDAADESAFLAADAMTDLELPNGMKFRLSASDYVRDWVLPNLYFHVTIAYAIMRSKGVDLGKADLVPHMLQHLNTDG